MPAKLLIAEVKKSGRWEPFHRPLFLTPITQRAPFLILRLSRKSMGWMEIKQISRIVAKDKSMSRPVFATFCFIQRCSSPLQGSGRMGRVTCYPQTAKIGIFLVRGYWKSRPFGTQGLLGLLSQNCVNWWFSRLGFARRAHGACQLRSRPSATRGFIVLNPQILP